jgi:hypothetical protein
VYGTQQVLIRALKDKGLITEENLDKSFNDIKQEIEASEKKFNDEMQKLKEQLEAKRDETHETEREPASDGGTSSDADVPQSDQGASEIPDGERIGFHEVQPTTGESGSRGEHSENRDEASGGIPDERDRAGEIHNAEAPALQHSSYQKVHTEGTD